MQSNTVIHNFATREGKIETKSSHIIHGYYFENRSNEDVVIRTRSYKNSINLLRFFYQVVLNPFRYTWNIMIPRLTWNAEVTHLIVKLISVFFVIMTFIRMSFVQRVFFQQERSKTAIFVEIVSKTEYLELPGLDM